MNGVIPFPTDPQSLAMAGIGLVGGMWLLIMRSGAFAATERARREAEQAS